MERITKRVDEDHACYAICEKECPDGTYADNPACVCTASKMAMKRLLEYEDTGLTPEQIRELKYRDTAEGISEMQSYGVFFYECPICNEPVHEKDNFCSKCGQRLKREE